MMVAAETRRRNGGQSTRHHANALTTYLRIAGVLLSALGCAESPNATVYERTVLEDGVDLPLRAASREQINAFKQGDAAFGVPMRGADGLGPFYIRTNCESCHEQGVRGPGFVQKMAIVLDDGVTPSPDQSALPFGHTVRPYVTSGATDPLSPPSQVATGAVKITVRMPPPILGRGYLEAIDDAEITRVEREQAARGDEIKGRINWIVYRSEANTDRSFHTYESGEAGLIGRFGLKARQPSLDDFTADALQGDMGITSPLRPAEPANPADLVDDDKAGVDVDFAIVNSVANYMRLTEIPARDPQAGSLAAQTLFAQALCSVCHVPALRTRSDYPIALLADIDAPVYSDLLLHDMGPQSADGLTDESATSTEWRTAPLIGLRFMKSFLHDGRAHSVEESIRLHGSPGSEAADSVERYQALSEADRALVRAFVESL